MESMFIYCPMILVSRFPTNEDESYLSTNLEQGFGEHLKLVPIISPYGVK